MISFAADYSDESKSAIAAGQVSRHEFCEALKGSNISAGQVLRSNGGIPCFHLLLINRHLMLINQMNQKGPYPLHLKDCRPFDADFD